MDIGKRIVRLRELKGWSQREIAIRVSLNVSVMNRIESGERPIKDHELIEIARVLGTSSDYLLGITDNSNHIDKDEEEFQAFANDPELGRWYKELPKSEEEDLQKLRQMWEIIRSDKNK